MSDRFALWETENLVEIISGRKRGLIPALIRASFSLLTPIYRLGIWWRNRRFNNAERESQPNRIKTLDIPVISIGNLTTGGTGKTPHVIWISRFLRSQGLRVAIISRGYGALPVVETSSDRSGATTAKQTIQRSRNDEALELEFRLPDVPHLQSPNRFEMGRTAVEELETQVVLLDDGFQHRQLHRDLDIVLIDATNPFGYQRLLPRGLLREPIRSLCRADVIVLTRCEQVDSDKLKSIFERLIGENASALIVETQMQPQGWLQYDGQQVELKRLRSQTTFSFCGIGNSGGFQKTLKQLNLNCVGHRIFSDHYNFTRDDLESVASDARLAGAEALVCTHKDLVKVGCNQLFGLPIYALLIDVDFVNGQDDFTTKILETIAGAEPDET